MSAYKQSLRMAVNEFCARCIYDPDGGEGGKAQQIAACTAKNCPLWRFRPTPRASHCIPERNAISAGIYAESLQISGMEGRA